MNARTQKARLLRRASGRQVTLVRDAAWAPPPGFVAQKGDSDARSFPNTFLIHELTGPPAGASNKINALILPKGIGLNPSAPAGYRLITPIEEIRQSDLITAPNATPGCI